MGRSLASDVSINDPSVSATHCEILFDGHAALVRDLGSTNGTFLNGYPIRESYFRAGQTLRLGAVEILFEPKTAAPVAEPAKRSNPANNAAHKPKLSVASLAKKNLCANHPGSPATCICKKCRRKYCEYCVEIRHPDGKFALFCPECGGDCLALGQLGNQRKRKQNFLRRLHSSLRNRLKKLSSK